MFESIFFFTFILLAVILGLGYSVYSVISELIIQRNEQAVEPKDASSTALLLKVHTLETLTHRLSADVFKVNDQHLPALFSTLPWQQEHAQWAEQLKAKGWSTLPPGVSITLGKQTIYFTSTDGQDLYPILIQHPSKGFPGYPLGKMPGGQLPLFMETLSSGGDLTRFSALDARFDGFHPDVRHMWQAVYRHHKDLAEVQPRGWRAYLLAPYRSGFQFIYFAEMFVSVGLSYYGLFTASWGVTCAGGGLSLVGLVRFIRSAFPNAVQSYVTRLRPCISYTG